jgi:tetratricopeptide (TPR) repeat protein
MGLRQSEVHTLVMLSQLASWSGDNELALTQIRAALEAAIAVQDSFNEVIALLFLGAAELAMGQLAEATVAYERARSLAHAIGHVLLAESQAGLALVALAQGDIARAMMFVEGLLDERTVGNAQRDRISKFVRLACYQVLARAGDPRASQQLARAHSELLAQAASIADAGLRDSFLNNVPEHRELIATWDAHQGGSKEPARDPQSS